MFSLKIEFLPGMDIRDAIEEASRFAEKLGVTYIKFKFNNVSMSIPPNVDSEESELEFYRETSKEKGFVIGKQLN